MKLIKLITTLVLCIVVISCSSTQKMTISGVAGTEIYNPYGEKIADIPSSGIADLEISSDRFYPYLLSHEPGSADYVPFGIDYIPKSYNGSRFTKNLGYGLTTLGMITLLSGTAGCIIAEKNENDDASSTCGLVVAGGAALMGIGIGVGMPADSRLSQQMYELRIAYKKNQQTIQNVQFTYPHIFSQEKPLQQKVKKEIKFPYPEGNYKFKGSEIYDIAGNKIENKITGTFKVEGKTIIVKYNDNSFNFSIKEKNDSPESSITNYYSATLTSAAGNNEKSISLAITIINNNIVLSYSYEKNIDITLTLQAK